MTDVESKLQQDIGPGPDTEPALDPLASTAARYFAAVAMTAVATILAVGVDKSDDPEFVARLRRTRDHRGR